MTLVDDFFLGTKLYHKKFNELCKPLANYLGANFICYITVDKQGRAFNTCTDLKWKENSLANSYYLVDAILVHPDNIHNGFAFDSGSPDQEYKDTLVYDAFVNFNICHGFFYIEKNANNDGYFGFGFATTKDNYQMINKVINQSQLIRKLIRNLNKKLLLMIPDLEEKKVNFSAMKGDSFYSQRGLVFNEEYENKHKIQLLKDSGILTSPDLQDFLINVRLSPQEINCLRIYFTTHSIKKVSKELNLALATTTSYIENIKCKLNCTNKNELFEKTEILESLGCI